MDEFDLKREWNRAVRVSTNPLRRVIVTRILNRNSTAPKVVVNSIPKSGTHLLMRCVGLMPDMRALHDGVLFAQTKDKYPLSGQKRTAETMPNGSYVAAHLPYREETDALFQRLNIKHLVIFRDPRDVAVSYYKFVKKYRWVPHHDYFVSLPNDEVCLERTIIGDEENNVWPIGRTAKNFVKWQDKNCCIVRFEALVGSRGGGDDIQQRETIEHIAQYIGVDLPASQVDEITDNLFGKGSRTFRKGTIGDWPNYYSEQNKQLFKEHAGQLLIDLGYESDFDW